MMDVDKKNRNATFSAGLVFAIVMVLVAAAALLSKEDLGTGTFGDSFGILTALFSGVALAGLWLTIRLQQIELAATRAELRAQAEALTKQSFESTFFAAVALLHRAESEVRNPSNIDPAAQGRQAFIQLIQNLNAVDGGRLGKLAEGDGPDAFKPLYNSWFGRNAQNVSSYFDLLLEIFRLIDRSQLRDRQLYANVIRASTSAAQKHLIFYHATLHDSAQALKSLLERYAFFRNFDLSQICVIPPVRRLWYGADATGPGVLVDGQSI